MTVKLPGGGGPDTCWVVSATCMFEHHKISPDPKHAMDFLISILKNNIVSSLEYATKSKERLLTMVFDKLALSVFRNKW